MVELQMGTVDCVEGQALGQHVMQQAAAVLQIHMCLALSSQQLRRSAKGLEYIDI